MNDTGKTAHGFEIELEGLHSSDITGLIFGGAGRGFPTTVERYGAPSISYLTGSVFWRHKPPIWQLCRWRRDAGTPSGVFTTPGESWTGGGIGYGPSTPRDHFWYGHLGNATKTTYSWLVESTPGASLTDSASSPARQRRNGASPPHRWLSVSRQPASGSGGFRHRHRSLTKLNHNSVRRWGQGLHHRTGKPGRAGRTGGQQRQDPAGQSAHRNRMAIAANRPGNPQTGQLENGGLGQLAKGRIGDPPL